MDGGAHDAFLPWVPGVADGRSIGGPMASVSDVDDGVVPCDVSTARLASLIARRHRAGRAAPMAPIVPARVARPW